MAEIDQLISKEALDSVARLETSLGKVIVNLDKLVERSQSLDKLLSALNATATSQDKLTNAIKQANKESKELKLQEDKIVKSKLEFSRAVKEQRDRIAQLIAEENKEAGTIEKLNAANKRLREEQRKLNLETQNGIQRNKEINAQLNKNTEFIKKNSDAYVQTKMNVGNYAQSIIQSVKSMVSAGAVIALVTTGLRKLKEAFENTVTGMTFMNQVAEVSKQIFYDLATTMRLNVRNMMDVAAIAKEMSALRQGDIIDMLHVTRLENDIKDLRYKAADATLAQADQQMYLNQAIEKENELIDFKVADAEEELAVIGKLLAKRPEDFKLQQEFANKLKEIDDAKSDRNLRLMTRESAIREKQIEEDKKAAEQKEKWFKEIEEDNKESLDKRYTDIEQAAKNEYDLIERSSTQQVDRVSAALDAEIAAEKEAQAEKDRIWQEGLVKAFADFRANKEAQQELRKKEVEDERLAQEEINQIKQEALNAANDIIQSAIEMVNNSYQAQYNELETQKKNELKRAGDDEKKKEKIEEKYAKKKQEIAVKEAKAEKASGLVSVAVSTAQGIMSAWSKGPIYGAIMTALIVAMGAMQMAAIASQPLPTYAKGTRYSKRGPAIVGEKGRELRIEPGGQMSLTSDKAELTYLKEGTKIFPAGETAKIVAMAPGLRRDSNDAERRHKELVKAIEDKPTIIIPTTYGNSITERKGQRFKEYFQRHIA